MAETSQDEAAKARIIKHLNADHADSLSYYLQYYCCLSPRAARGGILSSISLSAMTLRTRDGKAHTIPFHPPMKAWSETRARSVEMDREARSALNISSIRINEYEPPRKPVHVAVFVTCFFTVVTLATHSLILPGTWVYDVPLRWFPGGPEMFLWLARTIFWPFIAIHIFESWNLDRTRLRKHGVERGTTLWWKWITSCCIEGYGCYQRIDATVAKKTKEVERVNH
ncbi:hypothetical protein PZA11_005656 [Diplocarpon coronariae]|nr:hypothetical protein JHW43_007700 [Diplocarpon mali]